MTAKLATISKSRVFSINYRLCPQSPFPAQLVDILLGYMYLLYPPPGSIHTPIPASRIIFVGDSFGALLFLALTQVLLTLNNHPSRSNVNRTIPFHGQDVLLPLPAGITLVSPYSYTPDIFPSWEYNRVHDWFPIMEYPVIADPALRFCEAWPTKPLRGDLYCDISMLGHPLVCISAAKSWKGSPPMYMASGQERTIDSAKIIASQAVRDGVTVCWEEYEGMPHIFMTFFPQWKQSDMCYKRWVAFARKCLEHEDIKTKGVVIGCEDLRERQVDVGTLSKLSPKDATRLIEAMKKKRTEWLETFKKAKSLL
jgi:acetyl esterase/lipase